MGRVKAIDRDAILDAAEKVVIADGAARLTLDAVAAEAGISKASVIYDYKTKHGLIKAVIERMVARKVDRLQSYVYAVGPVPNQQMLGRLAAAGQAVPEDECNVGLNLIAALAHDPELQAIINNAYAGQIAEVKRTAADPDQAMIAFLALEGLTLVEKLGFFRWPEAERMQLIEKIRGLITQNADSP